MIIYMCHSETSLYDRISYVTMSREQPLFINFSLATTFRRGLQLILGLMVWHGLGLGKWLHAMTQNLNPPVVWPVIRNYFPLVAHMRGTWGDHLQRFVSVLAVLLRKLMANQKLSKFNYDNFVNRPIKFWMESCKLLQVNYPLYHKFAEFP